MKKVQRILNFQSGYDKKTTALWKFLRRSRQLRQSTEVLRRSKIIPRSRCQHTKNSEWWFRIFCKLAAQNAPCYFKCWQGRVWFWRNKYAKICLQLRSYKLYTVCPLSASCQDMYIRVHPRDCFAELRSSLTHCLFNLFGDTDVVRVPRSEKTSFGGSRSSPTCLNRTLQ